MLLLRSLASGCTGCSCRCAAPGTVSTARPQTNHRNTELTWNGKDEKATHCMTSYHYSTQYNISILHLHWTIPIKYLLRDSHSHIWNEFLHCICSRSWGSHVDTAKLACTGTCVYAFANCTTHHILVSYALHITTISLSLFVGAADCFMADIGSKCKKANQN